jgi:hypothetical protein
MMLSSITVLTDKLILPVGSFDVGAPRTCHLPDLILEKVLLAVPSSFVVLAFATPPPDFFNTSFVPNCSFSKGSQPVTIIRTKRPFCRLSKKKTTQTLN